MKKKLKIVSIVCALSILFCSNAVSAKTINNTNSDKSITVSNCTNEDVEKLLNNYFSEKYLMLSTLQYRKTFENYISETCDEDTITDIIIEHRNLQLSDLGYKNYNVYIEIEKEIYTRDLITITAEERASYVYNCSDDNVVTNEFVTHTISIKEVSGRLVVNIDNYDNDFKSLFSELKSKKNSNKKCKSKILSKSKAFVNKIKHNKESASKDVSNSTVSNKLKLTSNSTKSSFTKHSYNRTKAKEYALKYVLAPNSNYINIEAYGGNCTNFTSQCLFAGGIKKDTTGNYRWYYTNSNNRSPSWTDAQKFRQYYKNNKGSKTVKGLNANKCTFSALRLGDLVQMVNNNKAYHTMFVSGYKCDAWGMDNPWEYKYDVYICQNSTSAATRQKNVLLSTKVCTGTMEYVHINGCYY